MRIIAAMTFEPKIINLVIRSAMVSFLTISSFVVVGNSGFSFDLSMAKHINKFN